MTGLQAANERTKLWKQLLDPKTTELQEKQLRERIATLEAKLSKVKV